jgi:hypothetical protein
VPATGRWSGRGREALKKTWSRLFISAIRIQSILDLQKQLRQAVGNSKREFPPPVVNEELKAKVTELALTPLAEALTLFGKKERQDRIKAIFQDLYEDLNGSFPESRGAIQKFVEELERRILRERILKERIDRGTKLNEVRPISRGPSCPEPMGQPFYPGETKLWLSPPALTRRAKDRFLERETLTLMSLQFSIFRRRGRCYGAREGEIGHGALPRGP